MHFYTYHLSKSSMRKCDFFDNRICNVVYYHHAPYQLFFINYDFCKLILYLEEVILNNKGVVILILKVMLVTLLTEYLL